MKNLGRTQRKKSWWMREHGQALIEAAIAAPVFFLLLMGAGEMARLAYTAIEIQNSAEAGALYAIETLASSNDTVGIKAAAVADAGNLTGVNATETKTYYCSDGSTPDNSTTPATCTTGWTETSMHITTTVTFDPIIHIPGLPTTFTLHGFAAARCESC